MLFCTGPLSAPGRCIRPAEEEEEEEEEERQQRLIEPRLPLATGRQEGEQNKFGL
jgi:hypothetical protein